MEDALLITLDGCERRMKVDVRSCMYDLRLAIPARDPGGWRANGADLPSPDHHGPAYRRYEFERIDVIGSKPFEKEFRVYREVA